MPDNNDGGIGPGEGGGGDEGEGGTGGGTGSGDPGGFVTVVQTLVDWLPTYGSNGGSPDDDPNDLGWWTIDYLDEIFLQHDRSSGAADGDFFRGVAADWAMGFGSMRALAEFWELDNPGYGALYAIGSAFMGFIGFPAGRLAMELVGIGASLVTELADAIGSLFGLNTGSSTSQMTIEDYWVLMRPSEQDVWNYFYGNESGYNPWINPMDPPDRPPWEMNGYNASYMPPIVLDLNGDGVTLSSLSQSGARFDVDGDGDLEQVGWVTGGDGILAFDANDNGRVDGPSEFAFAALLAGAGTDLEGLRTFDSNGDGVLSAEDEAFLKFRIWIDDNDGVSEAGEVYSLADLGIRSIDLNGDGFAFMNQGNLVHSRLGWTAHDGGRHSAWDVGFAVA